MQGDRVVGLRGAVEQSSRKGPLVNRRNVTQTGAEIDEGPIVTKRDVVLEQAREFPCIEACRTVSQSAAFKRQRAAEAAPLV